jgi:hypothetical protein
MINDFAISPMSLHLFQAVVCLLRRANRDIGNEHPKHHFSGLPYLSSCRSSMPRGLHGLRRVAVIFNPDTSPQSKLFLPVIGRAFCPPKSSAEMLR